MQQMTDELMTEVGAEQPCIIHLISNYNSNEHKSLELLPVVLGAPVERLREGLVGPEVAREVRLEGRGLLEGDLEAHLQHGHREVVLRPRRDPQPG